MAFDIEDVVDESRESMEKVPYVVKKGVEVLIVVLIHVKIRQLDNRLK